MHWQYSAAIVVGFVFVLVVGLTSVLHDLIAIDDCHHNDEIDEIIRRRRTSGAGPAAPSHKLVGGANGNELGLGVHDSE